MYMYTLYMLVRLHFNIKFRHIAFGTFDPEIFNSRNGENKGKTAGNWIEKGSKTDLTCTYKLIKQFPKQHYPRFRRDITRKRGGGGVTGALTKVKARKKNLRDLWIDL